jgi:hypothetical protein
MVVNFKLPYQQMHSFQPIQHLRVFRIVAG